MVVGLKVGLKCAACLVYRAWREVKRATQDEELRFKVLSKVVELIGREFRADNVPSYIGTKRDRLIKALTGNPDPYKVVKAEANRKALRMLPMTEAFVENAESDYERFLRACKLAALGNALDYDVLDHIPELKANIEFFLSEGFAIDHSRELYRLATQTRRILYLTDNAGEIAFDTILVRELKRLGCTVTVAVKGGPILNDATLEDAKTVGMDEIADRIMTTGTDAVGVLISECSKEFIDEFKSASLIVAKGMSHWETITDFGTPCKTAFLMRVKCETVASSLGAKPNQNVLKIVPKGFRIP